jgi:hypothetical protein
MRHLRGDLIGAVGLEDEYIAVRLTLSCGGSPRIRQASGQPERNFSDWEVIRL